MRFPLAPISTARLHGQVALYTRGGLALRACILIISSKCVQHSCTGSVPTNLRRGCVASGRPRPGTSTARHVRPGVAVPRPSLQAMGVWGISCIFACIMAHTDSITRYRVCQLAYCSTLGHCWQSIYIQSTEAPKLQLIALKAACHCCTAPARLCLVLGDVQFTSTPWTCTWSVLRSKCVNCSPSEVYHVRGGRGVWWGSWSPLGANPASSASCHCAVSRSDSSKRAWSALPCRLVSGLAR